MPSTCPPAPTRCARRSSSATPRATGRTPTSPRASPTDDHVRREPHLAEIEAQWGPAPGRSLADGHGINVLGAVFGNVFVGVQPPFGYEGDPMRLLFDGTFSPTHAFSAFYRWVREDFGAHAALHFGTHGALEFMPGKQAGLSATSWPDRLIGDLPNFYLYASNNPSEGTIAKRRSNATLISYLTPPIAQSGLYKGLLDLNATIERYRATAPDAAAEREMLALLIQEQAAGVDLVAAEPTWTDHAAEVTALAARVYELEQTLIPHGLHVVGRGCTAAERVDLLCAIAEARGRAVYRDQIVDLVAGLIPADADGDTFFADLAATDALLAVDSELGAIVHALDGGYIAPAPGGDVLRTPAVLPTGRNIHGFDPFRIPSAFATRDGAKQAQRLIDRHAADGAAPPESVAMVLWGTDNLKTEGAQIAQVMALMGARPRFDGYGRLCGAELIPLADLGRARIDVVVTLSGIFRDLLPMQTRMIAEAAWLATVADEPEDQNFIRKHSLAHAAKLGVDLDTAALRVFSNAEGAYGANVNLLIDAGVWSDENELADSYETRKGFAYGRNGAAGEERSDAADQPRARRPDLSEPRLGRARRHLGRPICRQPRRHQPVDRARQGCRRPGLYRRPDAGRGQGPHIRRAGRARNPHPDAQPAVDRGDARVGASKASARSRST